MALAVNRRPFTAEALVNVEYFWAKWHWERIFSEFLDFPINIIAPWLSILIHNLEAEQKAIRWPQFRRGLSQHRHEQQQR
jgi:hypothetical protein